MGNRIAVFRRERFNAAHRLHSQHLSDAENVEVFGKCNYPNFHGHNYEVVVRVSGEPDERTGYLIDMKELSRVIRSEVVERFDHKNLNLDTEEFKALNPTAENIAMVIHGLLRRQIDKRFDLKVTLYETERNYVEFPA
jgi:6-pyruvoyltetrahydropterin/6-carboxytetrahydropterin synthase